MEIQVRLDDDKLRRLNARLATISSAGQLPLLLRKVLDLTAIQTRARVDKILAKELKLKKSELKKRKINPISFLPELGSNYAKLRIFMGGKGQNLAAYPYKEVTTSLHFIRYYISRVENPSKNRWVSEWTTRGGISVKYNGEELTFPNGFKLKGRGGNWLLFERLSTSGTLKNQIRSLREDNASLVLRRSSHRSELYSYVEKRMKMNIAPAARCIIAKISNQAAKGCF